MLMKLIVITRPDLFAGEADALRLLFEAGLETLHLRKPGAAQDDVEQLLKALPAPCLERIVIHGHHDLALRYPLRGIHLNRQNPEPPPSYGGTTSRSCHTLAEVEEWAPRCRYVFLSPVFDSISKQGYTSHFSAACLRRAHDTGCLPSNTVALGGVTPGHIARVRSLGFGGVAVLGDLWKHTGPGLADRFDEFRRAVQTPPVVLSIAGSDCSGGAGVQADLKTIEALGGYGASAVTALTVQNTRGVRQSVAVDPALIFAQIRAVLDDLPVGAVKIGMVPGLPALRAILDALAPHPGLPVVYDPVMVSTSGSRLMEADTLAAVKAELIPRCTLLTPNLPEAAVLTGTEITTPAGQVEAACTLGEQYHTYVLLKGGHLKGDAMRDVLWWEGGITPYKGTRVISRNLHGTGCTLSSAIATHLAAGMRLTDAVARAKDYVARAILHASHWRMGEGNGPLCHFFTENNKVI